MSLKNNNNNNNNASTCSLHNNNNNTMSTMEIKQLQKSSTFSSLASGGQRLGTWFDRRARKISMKCSKSITLGRSFGC